MPAVASWIEELFDPQLYHMVFYHASRPFLYTFGCILYLINHRISLITSQRHNMRAGTKRGWVQLTSGVHSSRACAIKMHTTWCLCTAQILGTYSAVKCEYRPARQVIWSSRPSCPHCQQWVWLRNCGGIGFFSSSVLLRAGIKEIR